MSVEDKSIFTISNTCHNCGKGKLIPQGGGGSGGLVGMIGTSFSEYKCNNCQAVYTLDLKSVLGEGKILELKWKMRD